MVGDCLDFVGFHVLLLLFVCKPRRRLKLLSPLVKEGGEGDCHDKHKTQKALFCWTSMGHELEFLRFVFT